MSVHLYGVQSSFDKLTFGTNRTPDRRRKKRNDDDRKYPVCARTETIHLYGVSDGE